MNILVTGGWGFIGSHLAEALVEQGHFVRVLDNLEPQVHGTEPTGPGDYRQTLQEKVELLQGDIRDPEMVRRALRGVEAVYHLAAAVGVGQSMYEIRRYMEVNTLGTAILLETIVNHGRDLRKLIVASSMSIYGEGKYECARCGVVYPRTRPWLGEVKQREDRRIGEGSVWEQRCPFCRAVVRPRPTDEEKPLYPTSPYAIGKRDTEELALSVGRAYQIPTVALRYFNVYGPRQALSNPYTGAAAIFASRLLNGHPPIIYEDGLQTRDFIHVRDVVQANLLALEKDEANYEAFNVGTGRALSILDLARLLCACLNSDLEPQVVYRFRAGDIRHCYADLSKIQERLGFTPQVRFEEGVVDLVEWVRTQTAEDRFEQAVGELEARGLV
ncbi:MAG TPA: NAD-dependent epimerase/dehydratase family protein [Armatimonadetes bacterium]|nr:NAD-dependent epimerase/dehydratase family protein [Armatimonadota bacterium]